MDRAWQHLRAPNDGNGNPRRLFVVYRRVEYEGETATGYWGTSHVFDEGYGGRPQALNEVPELPSVNIGAAEYRRLKKRWAAMLTRQ